MEADRPNAARLARTGAVGLVVPVVGGDVQRGDLWRVGAVDRALGLVVGPLGSGLHRPGFVSVEGKALPRAHAVDRSAGTSTRLWGSSSIHQSNAGDPDCLCRHAGYPNGALLPVRAEVVDL